MLDSYVKQYYPDQSLVLDSGDVLTITALERFSNYIDAKASVATQKLNKMQ